VLRTSFFLAGIGGYRLSEKPKGIGLLSGGLDSAVAALVARDAGADVECLHFFTGFCVTGHNSRVGRRDRPIANHALQVAAEMGIPVELVDIAEDYLPMVLNPKFGYGRNMNPCVDCRVFMLSRAREHMEKIGGDFVFTGEVLGQRPKSQLKSSLRIVEQESRLEGRLLRPLSAKLLRPTRVEEEGRVDRGKLLDIHGRGRKKQIALAKEYGLSEFMQPAGGCCFLTDESYTRKFKDVVTHKNGEELEIEDVFVLGVGRHFRLASNLKLIVGRDEVENNFLSHYAREHWSVIVNGFAGPTAILMGEFKEDDMGLIASVVARYSDGKHEPAVEVKFSLSGQVKAVTTVPATEACLEGYRV
jgi:tRNA U34 2-thiouridine synthase MnmA/TrmU